MPRRPTIYTVSFLHTDGTRQVSRYFQTLKGSRNWSKWLLTTSFVQEVYLHRGNVVGEELLETFQH